MKRFISILISAVLMLSLVACGGGSATTEGGSDNAVEKTKKQPVRSELYYENGTILADISYEYDADGRKISNTTSWNYGFGEGSETDAYTYDENGKMTGYKNVGAKDNSTYLSVTITYYSWA